MTASNLPLQLTSFIGHQRELVELKRLLPTTRLLTLTGSGGVGKTRLALQLAANAQDAFKDGVWLIELAPLSDFTLVPISIASVLGVSEEPGQTLMTTLLGWLRSKQLLLVLDNCEHLIEACAKFADDVLHASRDLWILATSREALGIGGELAWRVPSLPTPNPGEAANIAQLEQYGAVQLFIERASFALPTFAVTKANALAIAKICFLLDGIPLAIELAAIRVKSMRVEQISARLDDRFRLLTGGRAALPRHQTLRSLVDWSYSLLSTPERLLLRRLAVFAGGWTLEATEAVCAGDGIETYDGLDLLSRLVDKSLVLLDQQSDHARYRMLETIRLFAREKLQQSGEEPQVQVSHLDYFLKFAEENEAKLKGSDQILGLRLFDAEHDNLRAALKRCETGQIGAEKGLQMASALG